MQQRETENDFDTIVKVIVVGDSGVGKTKLITRFCDKQFTDDYKTTIGVDFGIKKMKYQNCRFKMQIWDTAGQQRFKNINQLYYRGADGIVLAYSTTDRHSFCNIERWIMQIEAEAPTQIAKVLVSTKLDLIDDRNVSREEGRALATRTRLNFVQLSAKTGEGVEQAFQQLISIIYQKWKSISKSDGLKTMHLKHAPSTQSQSTTKSQGSCPC